MTTAIVLSGGANLGAVHVGMIRALIEADVTPDLIVGTSVGAINGAYMSSRWTPAGVAGPRTGLGPDDEIGRVPARACSADCSGSSANVIISCRRTVSDA